MSGRAELLEAAGVAASNLEDPDRRIPLASYVALMRTAKRPLLGFPSPSPAPDDRMPDTAGAAADRTARRSLA